MKDDSTATVADLKALVRDFVEERDWSRYHTPRNVAVSIAIEAAELLERFQWLTDAESELAALPAKTRRGIEEELADVLAYVLSFANATGIDLAGALERKMTKNREKYPSEKFRGRYEKVRG